MDELIKTLIIPTNFNATEKLFFLKHLQIKQRISNQLTGNYANGR